MEDTSKTFLKACAILEGAVIDLLAASWEETSRRHALEMAVALRHAAHEATWWDAESELKAIESLLALSPHEALAIRAALAARLQEYLGLLKKAPISRSA